MNRKIEESALYECAITIFGDKGYDGARVSDIAKKLGIVPSAVYRYARDKKNLYRKSLAFGYHRWLEAGTDAMSSVIDPLEQLIALALAGFRYLQKDEALLKMILGYPTALGRISNDSLIQKEYELSINVLEKILAAGNENGVFRKMNPALASRAFYSTYMHFVEKIYMEREHPHTWEVVLSALEIILQGLISRDIDEDRPRLILEKYS